MTALRPLALSLLLSCAAAAPALAQSKTVNAPIAIDTGSCLADMNAKAVTCTGDVRVTQGDIRMRADKMRVQLKADGRTPDKIYADGGVVVNSPSGTATGDKGVYDVTPRLVTLTGKVVLTKDKNVARSNQVTVNLITGQATYGGGQGPGSRVQAVFYPTPAASAPPTLSQRRAPAAPPANAPGR